MALTAAAVVVGAGVILFDPIFQGLAISLMAGEVASLLLSRMAVPVLYYMAERHEASHGPRPGGAIEVRRERSKKESIMTIERCAADDCGRLRGRERVAGDLRQPLFLWFTLFVGLNLFQSAFTKWCPMMAFLRKAGVRS